MSLSARIIVRLAITSTAATAVMYGWLYIKQSQVDAYLRQRTLVRQAEEIASYISTGVDDTVEVTLPPKLSEAYNSPGSRYRYAVRDESGRIVATSGPRVGPLPIFIESRDHDIYKYRSENAVGFDSAAPDTLGAAVRTNIGKKTYFTQVERAMPITQSLNASVFNEFFMDGGWLGVPLLVALLGISSITVKRSLAPLKDLAELASQIEPGNSAVRLPLERVPKEILPLISSFNNALDRLDEGLRQQQEFNANAAHQLRTPLAVLAANIDTLNDSNVAGRLRYDVDLMSRIVNQLLVVARLETFNINIDEPVDLCLAARQAAENLGPIAIEAHNSLEVDEPPAPVMICGNAFVVTIAISNLIENALNHSPPGTPIRVSVTASASVAVSDRGPGVPIELRDKIFERFWRGDSGKEGAGLGLAIVRRIMQALNGTVAVQDASEGGAVFTLQFAPYVKSRPEAATQIPAVA